MKRTNVVLDETLPEEAIRVPGRKTYSATISFALKEAMRMHRMESLTQFFGQGLRAGNLAEMRQVRTPDALDPASAAR